MPMPAELVDTIQSLVISSQQLSAQHANLIAENLLQGLALVQTTVVQAQASHTDDPVTIAALQTASKSPAQGANP